MNVRQICAGVILGIVLGIYDAVFATFAPAPLSYVRLLLPILAFCIAIERIRFALVVAVTAGLVAELFAVGPSGFALLRVLAAVGAAWLLQSHVLTNRSLYATVLLACAVRLVDIVWLLAVSGLRTLLHEAAVLVPAWDVLLKRAGMDIVVVAFLFLLQTLLTRGFSGFRRRSSL